jgi:hypothetical protein
MKNKHTPGPWTIETPMGDDLPWLVQADKPTYEWRCIAQLSLEEDVDDIPRDEALWNLHLMSAAPEMYKALCDWLSMAETAIRDYGVTPSRKEQAVLAQAREAIAKAEASPRPETAAAGRGAE